MLAKISDKQNRTFPVCGRKRPQDRAGADSLRALEGIGNSRQTGAQSGRQGDKIPAGGTAPAGCFLIFYLLLSRFFVLRRKYLVLRS